MTARYFLVLALVACGVNGFANDFFVSPNGSRSGTGSITNPWDIYTAVRATNSIQPGDTLYLRGGTYLGGWLTNYAGRLNLLLVGTSNNPVTVRPYKNEKPILSIGLADQTGEILIIGGTYTILRDVEIVNQSTNRLTWANYAVSITVQGTFNKIINCYIHDTGEGPYIMLSATNTEVYGCMIYNNGQQNQIGRA